MVSARTARKRRKALAKARAPIKYDACARLHNFWRGYLTGEQIWVVCTASTAGGMRFIGLRRWEDVDDRARVRDVEMWMTSSDAVTELTPNSPLDKGRCRRGRSTLGIHKYLRGGRGLMAMVSTHSDKALRMNFNEAIFDFGVAIHEPIPEYPGMGLRPSGLNGLLLATFDHRGVHVVTESERALVERRQNGYLSALSNVGLSPRLAGIAPVVGLIRTFAYPSVWLPRTRVGERARPTNDTAYKWH